MNKLIPDDRQYFTYPGSLTTPPLYESVSWIVFKKEVKLSQRQVHKEVSQLSPVIEFQNKNEIMES